MSILGRDVEEGFKGAIHAHVASVVAAMALYNAAAYAERRESRLGWQALLYTGLCVYEWRQTFRHWHG